MSGLNEKYTKEQLSQFNASHTDADIEAALSKSSGDGLSAGDWTQAGLDSTGFPVPEDSAEDVTAKVPSLVKAPVTAEGTN